MEFSCVYKGCRAEDFATVSDLNKHIKRCHGPPRLVLKYECNLCKNTFVNSETLRKHLERHGENGVSTSHRRSATRAPPHSVAASTQSDSLENIQERRHRELMEKIREVKDISRENQTSCHEIQAQIPIVFRSVEEEMEKLFCSVSSMSETLAQRNRSESQSRF